MASITPYGGGWRVQLSVKGQRESETFATKRDAQAWAARRESELRAQAADRAGDYKTLRDAMRRYALEVAPTHKGYRWELVRLAARPLGANVATKRSLRLQSRKTTHLYLSHENQTPQRCPAHESY